MASQRQIEANRRNARKSTGPRTIEGKQLSRWNALRHGLAAVHTVLPHEDLGEYHRIRGELIRTWQPANAQELMLVDQVASGYWRMQRAQRVECAILDTQVRALKAKHGIDTIPRADDDNAVAVSFLDDENQKGFRTFLSYDGRAQATCYRALDRLRQLQNDRLRRARTIEKAQPEKACAAAQGMSESLELASFHAGGQPELPPPPDATEIAENKAVAAPVNAAAAPSQTIAATPVSTPVQTVTSTIAPSSPRSRKAREVRRVRNC